MSHFRSHHDLSYDTQEQKHGCSLSSWGPVTPKLIEADFCCFLKCKQKQYSNLQVPQTKGTLQYLLWMYVQEQQKMPLIGTFQKHFSPIRVSNDSKWHCLGDSSSVNYKEPSKLRREEWYSVLISADKYGLSFFTRYFRHLIRGKHRTEIIVFTKNRDYENKTEHLLNSAFLSGVRFLHWHSVHTIPGDTHLLAQFLFHLVPLNKGKQYGNSIVIANNLGKWKYVLDIIVT